MGTAKSKTQLPKYLPLARLIPGLKFKVRRPASHAVLNFEFGTIEDPQEIKAGRKSRQKDDGHCFISLRCRCARD